MIPTVKVNLRLPAATFYAEVVGLAGPQSIGDTGDNRYLTLYGRPWAVAIDRSGVARAYQGNTGGGNMTEVVGGLPSNIFGTALPATARRLTAAFDQSARIIVAYEDQADGNIRVTRWTGAEYTQNVTFAGADPQLLMDATLADPRGYPNAADDGWSVREAYYAGIPVLFEWLAGDPVVYLESPIPDSDVILFYLSTDRLSLYARVQRQLYATPILIHEFDQPVILDRAIALAGRYQLLVSDANGDPLPEMLISDPYLGEFLINPQPADALAASGVPEDAVVEQTTYRTVSDEVVQGANAPESVVVVGDVAFVDGDDAVTGSAAPEDAEVVGSVALVDDSEAVTGAVTPEDVLRETLIEPSASDDAMSGTAEPEDIRVQAT